MPARALFLAALRKAESDCFDRLRSCQDFVQYATRGKDACASLGQCKHAIRGAGAHRLALEYHSCGHCSGFMSSN